MVICSALKRGFSIPSCKYVPILTVLCKCMCIHIHSKASFNYERSVHNFAFAGTIIHANKAQVSET